MIHLPGVLAAAGEVQSFCQSQGWRFCFIGVLPCNAGASRGSRRMWTSRS